MEWRGREVPNSFLFFVKVHKHNFACVKYFLWLLIYTYVCMYAWASVFMHGCVYKSQYIFFLFFILYVVCMSSGVFIPQFFHFPLNIFFVILFSSEEKCYTIFMMKILEKLFRIFYNNNNNFFSRIDHHHL